MNKKETESRPNLREKKVWIHFLLDWLNKIRTWLKKLISDTISLTENVRENNLTRQNNSAEKILTENPTQNLSEKIFEF